MSRRLRVCRDNAAVVILTSVSLVLVFPGYNFSFLAWLALVPLLLLVQRSGYGGSFFCSLLTGLIFFAGLLWWNLRVGGFTPVNFFLSVLGLSLYLGVFGMLANYFHRQLPRWSALIVPVLWVLLEFVRSHAGFLSISWGILGYSQYTVLPVAHIASFTGVYGVSFCIVAVNSLLADTFSRYVSGKRSAGLRKRDGRQWNLLSPGSVSIIFVGLVIILISSISTSLAGKDAAGTLRAAVIQGGIYWFESKDQQLRKKVMERYLRLSLESSRTGPRLIVWPSSSVPGIIPADRSLVHELARLARKTKTYLLVGSAGYDKLTPGKGTVNRVANSAFLFAPDGKILERYDKIRLLPFDEYLPLRGYVKWPSWISADMTDSMPGNRYTVFAINDGDEEVKFCVLICWENYFPEQFRKMASQDIDFMVTLTNDAFTDAKGAYYQMLAVNVFRAIENRVTLLRASTTGISGIIGPDGRLVDIVHDGKGNAINIVGSLAGDIALSGNRTFFTRHGNWFIYCLATVLLFFTIPLFFIGGAPASGNHAQ